MATKDDEEALFWILDDYIWHYSHNYELHNRVRYVDTRRLAFETRREMYACIGEPYYSMNENKICEILNRAPFDDKQSRELDLVHDFERLAQQLWGHIKAEPNISYEVIRVLKYFIDKPYRGEYGGIKNFSAAFNEMCTNFEALYIELEYEKMDGESQKVFTEMNEIRAMIFLSDNN